MMVNEKENQHNKQNKNTSLWGRIVFRYAGRNVCSQNSGRSRFFYNLMGRFYDRFYTAKIGGYRDAAMIVADRYVKENEVILDLGCGTGMLTDLIVDKAAMVIGCDLSEGMIRCAQKKTRHSNKAHFVIGNCLNIPINCQFDRVLSAFMMVILGDEQQQQTLKNINNLLKPGGNAVFLTSSETAGSQWWSRERWTKCTKQAGFDNIVFEDLFKYYRIVQVSKPE